MNLFKKITTEAIERGKKAVDLNAEKPIKSFRLTPKESAFWASFFYPKYIDKLLADLHNKEQLEQLQQSAKVYQNLQDAIFNKPKITVEEYREMLKPLSAESRKEFIKYLEMIYKQKNQVKNLNASEVFKSYTGSEPIEPIVVNRDYFFPIYEVGILDIINGGAGPIFANFYDPKSKNIYLFQNRDCLAQLDSTDAKLRFVAYLIYVRILDKPSNDQVTIDLKQVLDQELIPYLKGGGNLDLKTQDHLFQLLEDYTAKKEPRYDLTTILKHEFRHLFQIAICKDFINSSNIELNSLGVIYKNLSNKDKFSEVLFTIWKDYFKFMFMLEFTAYLGDSKFKNIDRTAVNELRTTLISPMYINQHLSQVLFQLNRSDTNIAQPTVVTDKVKKYAFQFFQKTFDETIKLAKKFGDQGLSPQEVASCFDLMLFKQHSNKK